VVFCDLIFGYLLKQLDLQLICGPKLHFINSFPHFQVFLEPCPDLRKRCVDAGVAGFPVFRRKRHFVVREVGFIGHVLPICPFPAHLRQDLGFMM